MNRRKFRRKEVFQGLLCAAIFVCLATGIGWLFRLLQFPETNIVVVYILSVILTARFTDGYIWGILATVCRDLRHYVYGRGFKRFPCPPAEGKCQTVCPCRIPNKNPV